MSTIEERIEEFKAKQAAEPADELGQLIADIRRQADELFGQAEKLSSEAEELEKGSSVNGRKPTEVANSGMTLNDKYRVALWAVGGSVVGLAVGVLVAAIFAAIYTDHGALRSVGIGVFVILFVFIGLIGGLYEVTEPKQDN